MVLVTKNYWVASIDLKDAYHSVKAHEDFEKHLFSLPQKTLQIHCLSKWTFTLSSEIYTALEAFYELLEKAGISAMCI